jgi:Protein of unknown function (DUF3138)
MTLSGPTAPLALLTLALAAAFPAAAQSNAELLNELRALRERVNQLEAKLASPRPAAPAAAPAAGQWGMTPEQARELNRAAMKVEATEDNLEAQGLKLLTITGYMDPTFMYNRAQDRAGFQFLNGAGDDGYNYDNSYMGAVSIDFTKETESGTRYKLTLVPSRGTDSVMTGSNRLVHEASVSIPLQDLQTRLIAGHIPDWSGYEYLQPTLNKLITHNLLFDFTLPTAYTGVGMDVTSGKWWLRGMLANVNTSQKTTGNNRPSLVGRVDYSKGEFDGFGGAFVVGEMANFADPNGNDSLATLFEVDGYFTRGDWSLSGQASFGQQKKAAITPDPVTGALRDSSWWGLSGLAAYKFAPRVEGVMRADYINNSKNGGGLLGFTSADGRNGIGPDPAGDQNVGANRYALTFGLSYLLDANTTLKAEYRYDGADRAVFEYVNDGSYRKSNQLFGASVLVAF